MTNVGNDSANAPHEFLTDMVSSGALGPRTWGITRRWSRSLLGAVWGLF